MTQIRISAHFCVPYSLRAALAGMIFWLSGCFISIFAANLQISPVMLTFDSSQRSAEIRLSNAGESLLYGQVRIFKWDQENGEDKLTPTNDLAASPPIIKVGPKSEQLIRLVRADVSQAAIERSYRILIDEIPTAAMETTGVAIKLRYSVPVFVGGTRKDTLPDLEWQVWPQADGFALAVTNRGDRRAQVGATTLVDANGARHEITKGLLGYALPGKRRIWPLKGVPPQLDMQKLTAETRINTREETDPVQFSAAPSTVP